MSSTKKEARTHALEFEGMHISLGSRGGYLCYICKEHLNCPKRRRVVHEHSRCVAQEMPKSHSTEINPDSKKKRKCIIVY